MREIDTMKKTAKETKIVCLFVEGHTSEIIRVY